MARILIDGYNLMAVTGHDDREALLRALGRFRKAKSHKITIVFDGTHGGTFGGDRYHTEGVEVLFSPITVQADDTIEEMLASSKGAGFLVVSSDRRIQSAAQRSGATPVSSEEFAKKLGGASSVSYSDVPPWMEGRLDDEDDNPKPKKKGPSQKLSKEARRRKQRMNKL